MAILSGNNLPNAEKIWVSSHRLRDGTLVRGHYRKRVVPTPSPKEIRDTQQYVKALEEKEASLRLLEKASELEKRSRKYKSFDPAETWATRWVACPIAYLFPPERREEWLGDVYESNREMLHKDYPRWFVSAINRSYSDSSSICTPN